MVSDGERESGARRVGGCGGWLAEWINKAGEEARLFAFELGMSLRRNPQRVLL